MTKLTLSKASEVYGKDRKTLYRHVKNGQLSRDSDGKIDMAELIRAYGEPQKKATEATTRNNGASLQSATPHDTEILHQQISGLNNQIKELRKDKDRQIEELKGDKERLWKELEEEQKERRQALRLLEDKREGQQPNPKSINPQVLWVFLPVCVIITAMPIVVWFLLNFLKQ